MMIPNPTQLIVDDQSSIRMPGTKLRRGKGSSPPLTTALSGRIPKHPVFVPAEQIHPLPPMVRPRSAADCMRKREKGHFKHWIRVFVPVPDAQRYQGLAVPTIGAMQVVCWNAQTKRFNSARVEMVAEKLTCCY